ncbi:unnamed protein product [Schistosoma curassoni]|uniref:Uncharacterized protein n=1 Tax=Schistosoma curassoni TaxID=6186 RepID=A0A183KF63_9TREM|nr:unnamed protein product [Schistosoma curassoni]
MNLLLLNFCQDHVNSTHMLASESIQYNHLDIIQRIHDSQDRRPKTHEFLIDTSNTIVWY